MWLITTVTFLIGVREGFLFQTQEACLKLNIMIEQVILWCDDNDACIFTCHLELRIKWFMSYLHYLCLFAHSGVQDILRCVFAWFFFVLCTLCCQFLWIVHIWLPLFYSLTFIQMYGFVFLTTQGHYIFYVNV